MTGSSRIGFALFRLKSPPRPTLAFGGLFLLEACIRHKVAAAARIAGPAIILSSLPGFASAQDATWMGPLLTGTFRPTGIR